MLLPSILDVWLLGIDMDMLGSLVIIAVALVVLVLVLASWVRFGWLWYQRGYFVGRALVWPIVWTTAAPIIVLAVWLFWYTHFGER